MATSAELRSRLDSALADLRHARLRRREEREALREAEARVAAASEAQALTQEVARQVQQSAHKAIATVVTRALRSVFGGDVEFRIAFASARGKTEARLLFVKDGQEEDPLGASSGGMIDVAAFALRLVCVLLSRPRRRRLLCLDEPFKNVNGEEYRERCRQLVEEMAERMGFQILISTGLNWLKCGKVIDVSGGV